MLIYTTFYFDYLRIIAMTKLTNLFYFEECLTSLTIDSMEQKITRAHEGENVKYISNLSSPLSHFIRI